MNGLRTARVLVLDNEIEEAKPFMEALAKRGIGSTYFSGNADMLPCPDQKLTGIRLAALDLDLGVGGEAPAVIGTLVGIVNRLVRQDNGPYLAIVWTGTDEEYFREFVNRQAELDCQPIHIIRMNKADYDLLDSGCIDEIFGEISGAVDESYPLSLLSFWEQSIHDSSGCMMEILPESADWMSQSKMTLRLLLDAAANRGSSQEAAFMALMPALNALQLDAIETAAMNQEDGTIRSLVSPLNDVHVPRPDEEDECKGYKEYHALKAALNYRLLCAAPLPALAPGNIYHCDDIGSGPTRFFPTLGELAFDAAKPDCRNNHRKLRAAGSVPIAMEVSPLCDYQQGGKGFPRFICGLAVPSNKICLLKEEALFLRQTDTAAFDIPPLEGEMLLVWNSHYIVSVPRTLVANSAALIRLRHAPLIDVQAWLGSQGNRPGYLSVRVGSDH